MPAVHSEMTIWGVKGGFPPPFFFKMASVGSTSTLILIFHIKLLSYCLTVWIVLTGGNHLKPPDIFGRGYVQIGSTSQVQYLQIRNMLHVLGLFKNKFTKGNQKTGYFSFWPYTEVFRIYNLVGCIHEVL